MVTILHIVKDTELGLQVYLTVKEALFLGFLHCFHIYNSGRIGYIIRVESFFDLGQYQMVIGKSWPKPVSRATGMNSVFT